MNVLQNIPNNLNALDWAKEILWSITGGLNEFKEKITLKEEAALFKEFTTIDADQTKDLKEKSSWFMSAIGSVFNINIPLLGTLGWAFGAKWPIDIFGSKEKRKKKRMINKLLGLFGIKWWLEELHWDYIWHNLREINNDFIKNAYQKYQELDINQSGESDLWDKFSLEQQAYDMDDSQKELIKAKLPSSSENLKNALLESLDGDVSAIWLNISVVAMLGQDFLEKDSENNVIGIDYQKIQNNKSEFVDAYLNAMVARLAFSGDDFINSKYANQDTFALAIFGCLLWERFFMEWVNLWLLTVNAYKSDVIVVENSEDKLDEPDGKIEELDKNKRDATMQQAELFVEKWVDYEWWWWRKAFNEWLDCSGLIITSMNNAGVISPGWDSREMFKKLETQKLELEGNGLKNLKWISKWDLLFWNSTNPKYERTQSKIPKITKDEKEYRIHHIAFVKNIDYNNGLVEIIESNWSQWVVSQTIDVKKELTEKTHKSELFVWKVDYNQLMAYIGEKKEVKNVA